MKTLHKSLHTILPFFFMFLLAFGAEAAETTHVAPLQKEQREQKVANGDDSTTEAKAEKKTKVKRKKLKVKRVNHGPRKPIFPQIHRKKEKLSRARYLNSHR